MMDSIIHRNKRSKRSIYIQHLLLKTRLLFTVILFTGSTLVAQFSAAQETLVDIRDMTPLLQEGRASPTAVNEAGQVVGYVMSADHWSTKAFIWDEANGYRELPSDPGTQTVLSDINNIGQIVGYTNPGAGEKPFIYADGTMTILPIGGANRAQAVAINDVGQIVGFSSGGTTDDTRVLVWERDSTGDWQVTQLPGLSDHHTGFTDINDLGQIVGHAGFGKSPWEQHAALWQKVSGAWQLTDLDSLGFGNSNASAINNLGQVVGRAEIINGGHRAFVWENGIMTDLGALESTTPFSRATDINDLSMIVGISNDPGNAGSNTAVLWKQLEGVWQIEDIDPDNQVPGWGVSRAYHINNAGLIAGETYSSDYGGFVWSEIQGLRLLPLLLGGDRAIVNGSRRAMNEQGYLIGRATVSYSLEPLHAVLWAVPPDELPPAQQLDNIQDEVNELVGQALLEEGQATALNDPLAMAVQLFQDQKIVPAVNLIEAFINKVSALVLAGQLSQEDGLNLIAAADAAIIDIENSAVSGL